MVGPPQTFTPPSGSAWKTQNRRKKTSGAGERERGRGRVKKKKTMKRAKEKKSPCTPSLALLFCERKGEFLYTVGWVLKHYLFFCLLASLFVCFFVCVLLFTSSSSFYFFFPLCLSPSSVFFFFLCLPLFVCLFCFVVFLFPSLLCAPEFPSGSLLRFFFSFLWSCVCVL